MKVGAFIDVLSIDVVKEHPKLLRDYLSEGDAQSWKCTSRQTLRLTTRVGPGLVNRGPHLF